MTTNLQITNTNQRIDVLDILRGIAIFGMIIPHVAWFGGADPVSKAEKFVSESIALFVDGRFYTIFAILFGASFAIQFAKAEAQNENFTLRFLRRLFALFWFGIAAEIFLGFQVLAEYAIAGLLLLVIRHWKTKTLLITFFICCMASKIYSLSYSYVYVEKHGAEQYISHMTQMNKNAQAASEMEENAVNYATAISARLNQIQLRYANPLKTFSGWILGNLSYFILGLLAIRTKIFQEPRKHMNLIILFVAAGLLSWGAIHWIRPLVFPPGLPNYYPKIDFSLAILKSLAFGFGIISLDWFAFIYLGVVLLLVAYSPSWLKRLAFFSWCGRMALTNYMLQALLISVLVFNYAINLPEFSLIYTPVIVIIIFGSLTLFSYRWLRRHNFGPLEWLWRSFTYWKSQPMKKKETLQIAEDIVLIKNLSIKK